MTEAKPRKKLTLKRKPKSDAASGLESKQASAEKPVKEFVRGKKRVIKMQSAAELKALKESELSPAERQSRELRRVLAESFSVWRRRRPLARGIDQDIANFVEERGLTISKRAIKKLLHRHTHHRNYVSNVFRGGDRFRLDVTVEGSVQPSEKDHAKRALDSLDS